MAVVIVALGESLAQRRDQKRQGSGGDKKAFHGVFLSLSAHYASKARGFLMNPH
jgi:hypothetical protein